MVLMHSINFLEGLPVLQMTKFVNRFSESRCKTISHYRWVWMGQKAIFPSKKTILNKDLSDNFFASIISVNGEVLGFEKPGVIGNLELDLIFFLRKILEILKKIVAVSR